MGHNFAHGSDQRLFFLWRVAEALTALFRVHGGAVHINLKVAGFAGIIVHLHDDAAKGFGDEPPQRIRFLLVPSAAAKLDLHLMLLLRVRDQRLVELFIGRTTAALVVGAKEMEPVQMTKSVKWEGTWASAHNACTHHRKMSADSRVVQL